MFRKERAIVLKEWPQPSTGPTEPRIQATGTSMTVHYRLQNDHFAVIHFPLCSFFCFGSPNDEALGGHPLSKHGIKAYSVHEVENSSLIDTLERRNSIHHRHDRDLYLKYKKHYIFTFHDNTLECVVNEGEWWKTTILTFDKEEVADRYWLDPKKV